MKPEKHEIKILKVISKEYNINYDEALYAYIELNNLFDMVIWVAKMKDVVEKSTIELINEIKKNLPEPIVKQENNVILN